jgi:hypothetical protein
MVLAGLAGGLAANLAMLLTFRLFGFGWQGRGILLDPARQSEKLMVVRTKLEPLPLAVTDPAPIIAGITLLGVGHAFIYRWLAPAWPAGLLPRALRLAFLLSFVSYLFWEFFTPFNQFGEPLPLILLELLFWAAVALTEGLAIAAVLEIPGKVR